MTLIHSFLLYRTNSNRSRCSSSFSSIPNTMKLPFLPLLFLLLPSALAWDSDQLEIFDLVEEINENFYALLGVAETAETSEIRKAYRKLSLQLHPDRNPAEDAEVKFRQLVAVNEVLKSPEKRQIYDNVLRDGLPNWRQPVYYFRKARKLGLFEMFVILFLISTVGHYLCIWAMYLEKKFEMEEVLFSQMKRKKEKELKRSKRDKNAGGLDALAEGVSEMVTDMLVAPTWHRLLPVQLALALKDIVVSAPENYRQVAEMAKEAWQEMKEKRAKEKSDDSGIEDEEEEEESVKREKKPKRKRVALPEYSESEVYQRKAETKNSSDSAASSSAATTTQKLPARSNAPWTEDDMSRLAKAMVRYPVGTLNRWEKVAEFVERTVPEIMQKNKEIRDTQFHRLNQVVSSESDSSSGGAAFSEEKTMLKKNKKSAQAMAALSSDVTKREESDGIETTTTTTMKENATSDDASWSQNQQKILEWALAQFPKGTAERWDKIAEHIPGKSKADCMQRYKYIVETLKQKKSAAS